MIAVDLRLKRERIMKLRIANVRITSEWSKTDPLLMLDTTLTPLSLPVSTWISEKLPPKTRRIVTRTITIATIMIGVRPTRKLPKLRRAVELTTMPGGPLTTSVALFTPYTNTLETRTGMGDTWSTWYRETATGVTRSVVAIELTSVVFIVAMTESKTSSLCGDFPDPPSVYNVSIRKKLDRPIMETKTTTFAKSFSAPKLTNLATVRLRAMRLRQTTVLLLVRV